MRAFAALIDGLVYTRSRNAKLAMLVDYLRSTPDPDRGWALAALTDAVDFPAVKAGTVRAVAATRVDEILLRLCRDHVGDTAETVALIWPRDESVALSDLSLSHTAQTLSQTARSSAPVLLASMLDRLDADGRYALLKFALGGMRVGVSARLAKTAFAQAFAVPVEAVEEYWHALDPPYAELFGWAAGNAPPPDLAAIPFFRPFMLAHPFAGESLDLEAYAVEWKWDGIRVQIASTGADTRLYSRGGEDISRAFPEVVAAFSIPAVVDGELLARGTAQGGEPHGGEAGSFNALQKRLGRKTVSAKMISEAPAFVRLYDVLAVDGEDVRAENWTTRRTRIEELVQRLPASHFDLSKVIDVADFDTLVALRSGSRDQAIEGLMLKRRDSPYLPGRRAGHWFKWKRDPLSADCVMMYAQRGNGRRASFYSDYTFGCWTDDGTLLPVGKAYSGFTDEELKWLDRFVRTNTLNRFGPVREVVKSLVLEVGFDAIQPSTRHKSGLAMRFPRILRIRKDKPAAEADRISTLQAMISG